MTTKQFGIGAVLSITTGKLLCDIGDVYEILNFMTGDNLYTHQLPRAMRECAPHLLTQFTDIGDVDTEGVTEENWRSFLAENEARFGKMLDVEPVPEHVHEFIDPLSELAEKVHPSKIIVLEA